MGGGNRFICIKRDPWRRVLCPGELTSGPKYGELVNLIGEHQEGGRKYYHLEGQQGLFLSSYFIPVVSAELRASRVQKPGAVRMVKKQKTRAWDEY